MNQLSSLAVLHTSGRLLADAAVSHGYEAFAVGGIVRDLCRGIPSGADLDFVIVGDALRVAQTCCEEHGGTLVEYESFRTATLHGMAGLPVSIDLVTARREQYSSPGALPVITPAALPEDLARRDFSINTLALAAVDVARLPSDDEARMAFTRDRCIGVENALSDLDRGIVRILHDRSFIDDPTRILRAARYVARIDGQLNEATEMHALEAVAAGALQTVSWQRLVRELEFLLAEESSTRAAMLLEHLGVFSALSLPSFAGLQERIGEELARIPDLQLTPNMPAVWKYSLFLLSADEELGAYTEMFGIGKKRLRHICSVRKSMQENDFSTLPVAGLLALLACGTGTLDRDHLQEALLNHVKQQEQNGRGH